MSTIRNYGLKKRENFIIIIMFFFFYQEIAYVPMILMLLLITFCPIMSLNNTRLDGFTDLYNVLLSIRRNFHCK